MDNDHNQISPDEYLNIAAELASAQREIDKATGRKRSILKRFKDHGGDLDAIALVRRLAKRDPDERLALMGNVRKYAAWESVILWEPDGQAAINLDDLERPSPTAMAMKEAADAYEVGYAGGKARTDPEGCPYDAGTEAFVEWKKGYRAGQETIAEQMGKNSRLANQSKARPVRKGDAPKVAKDAQPTKDPASKGRGRPPGAKNKPKEATTIN